MSAVSQLQGHTMLESFPSLLERITSAVSFELSYWASTSFVQNSSGERCCQTFLLLRTDTEGQVDGFGNDGRGCSGRGWMCFSDVRLGQESGWTESILNYYDGDGCHSKPAKAEGNCREAHSQHITHFFNKHAVQNTSLYTNFMSAHTHTVSGCLTLWLIPHLAQAQLCTSSFQWTIINKEKGGKGDTWPWTKY